MKIFAFIDSVDGLEDTEFTNWFSIPVYNENDDVVGYCCNFTTYDSNKVSYLGSLGATLYPLFGVAEEINASMAWKNDAAGECWTYVCDVLDTEGWHL